MVHTYVDGVSLTYGTPCKHLFTYAPGLSSDRNCPCAKYPKDKPPHFVQGNYYCESGSINIPAHGTVYSTNRCGMVKDAMLVNSCCSQAGMPWFYRGVLGKINEARICRDQT